MRVALIGGTGRSGTNVTKALLIRHSRAFGFPFEHRFTIDPDGLVDFLRTYEASWSPYIIHRRLERLAELMRDLQSGSEATRYRKWTLDRAFPGFADRTRRMLDELTGFRYEGRWIGAYEDEGGFVYTDLPRERVVAIFRSYLGDLIADLLAAHDADLFVEDNTWNPLNADVLAEIVPGACLVHVVRDPRDVVASLVQQRWAPADLDHALAWYRGVMDRWLALRPDLPDGFATEVKLEQLVADPEATTRDLCAFIGIDHEPEMAALDLSRSHGGRWRREFDAEQQAAMNRELEPYLIEYGYDESCPA